MHINKNSKSKIETNKFRRISSLNKEQLEQLIVLYKNEWWTNDRKEIDIIKLLKGGSVVFAYADPVGELAAFSRVLSDGVYKAFVFDVIVSEKFRGYGLATRLINDILTDDSISCVRHIELYCKLELNDFYKKFGFTSEVGPINLMRKIQW
jgi:predicted GNAT family N-acyltransferase